MGSRADCGMGRLRAAHHGSAREKGEGGKQEGRVDITVNGNRGEGRKRMMNQRNLARHELIGLGVKVLRAADRSVEGLAGTVSDESRNMLEIIRDGSGRRVRVAKEQCTFRFAIPGDGTADIEGRSIRFRPEDRIKRCK